MHISWLGNTSIKLQVKPLDIDITIVIDPYKQEKGNFPRSLTPNIALFTRTAKNSITLSGNPYILDTAGEIDTKDILITATEGHEEGRFMLRIDAEKMSIGHLGLTNKELTDKQIELLTNIDILFIPIGHEKSYTAETAIKIINSLEPRIVIPMAFKSDNDPEAKEITNFLKEMGKKDLEAEKKVIVKKKTLPEEEMQIILLEKE